VDYFDEAGTDPPNQAAGEAYLQQGNKMYHVAAFSTRKFYLEGITMYTDEFPSRARTFSRSVMSLSSSSTPDSKVRIEYYCHIIRCKHTVTFVLSILGHYVGSDRIISNTVFYTVLKPSDSLH
jgi:autophagy-related protein 2